ncbi:CBU_0585 family protein [Coxiella endosymbiont of Ornithodoros maritimus]|uniref:CBU_0585 family protein n=1 Tax=Coxiella endosymbiont of Ornithodoros maritimus TaxID=1656172 RepID=UPI00226510A2|nr:CBU_0585 family protein [Coxiella endosymbiont of Ornithodoros maritimus]
MFIKKKNAQKFPAAYISEIDKRLAEFDRSHAWSTRQMAEIKKYQRIFQLRSQPLQPAKKPSIWDFGE